MKAVNPTLKPRNAELYLHLGYGFRVYRHVFLGRPGQDECYMCRPNLLAEQSIFCDWPVVSNRQCSATKHSDPYYI